MKKKIITILAMFPLLFSCNNELKVYETNEFNISKPSFCFQDDILYFYKNIDTKTLTLVEIENVDNNVYMQSQTEWCSDIDKDPNTGYMSLKGYDNNIRIVMIKCKVLKDYYSKGTEGFEINVPFYLNRCSVEYYDLDAIISFFNSFDKMLLYFDIDYLEDKVYFENTSKQKEILFTNCNLDRELHFNYFMPIPNNKLDIDKYNSVIEYEIRGNYEEYLSNGMSLDEIEDIVKKIQDDADKAKLFICE